MAGWGSFHTFKNKLCAECGAEFTPGSGIAKYCLKCRGAGEAGSFKDTKTQYAGISGNWDRYFCRLLGHYGRFGFAIRQSDGLSKQVLHDLLKKQGGRCALSGVPMTCQLKVGVKHPTNASIDRVNPGADYSLSNIQLVCSAVNKFKYSLAQGEYIWWCQQVAEFSGSRKPSIAPGAIEEGREREGHGETA